MSRWAVFTIVGLLVLVACGGGRLTLSEYSSEVTALVETLDSRLDAEAEEYFSGPPSVEGLREYLAIRVDGYRNAVDGIDAIDPPEQVEDLHGTFEEIMGNLLAAQSSSATRPKRSSTQPNNARSSPMCPGCRPS
jgi:hypothetical protein